MARHRPGSAACVTDPTTTLVLANTKEATGSGEPLLSPDPTQPTCRVILGVPLLTSRRRAGSIPAAPTAALGLRGLEARKSRSRARLPRCATARRSRDEAVTGTP